ncbi:LOW QUALITY PROTEIN: golgin subfamily A member 6-like protein 22 [Bombus pyrosoma]|uniref:LOW QUALITY PROTEIN: golgin subfamily A member 6-like protein 22 n=1 Tax=Bombus pyrosoma TaxID=396416 RepID=UPI001CB9C0B2|nr:LOW QUALITY PROTEIN: golgin subfamily A member 6-like protein 22 [Bombus pyrosoma]
MKMCFWNVAGLIGKDKEVWEYLKTFDVIGLTETWTQESNWEKVKYRLPKEFEWKCRAARRIRKKGRAKGGIMTDIKKELKELEYKEISDNMVERKIAYKDKTFKIIWVYNQDTKGTWEEIEEKVDRREEEVMIIGGDWNARTGEEGRQINEDPGKERSRRSKDKTINAEGRILLRYLEERGWMIINGRDKEGEEWTYIGERGNSVIDYLIGNQEATEEIIDMKVRKRTESDHMPLEVEIGGPELQRTEEREEKEKERREWRRESMEKYLEECKDWTYEGRTVEELWIEIKNEIEEAMPKKKVKIRKWGMEENVWHDKEWKEREREVRRKMTKLRKGKCSREELMEDKKAFKQWKIKKEQEAWKYINKYRRRREGIDEEISEEECKNHFMKILEGKEHKEDRKTKEHGEEEKIRKEREDNIEKEEVIYQLRKLKEKATGEDGLENEVWKYAPKEVREALWELLRKIWNGEGIPEDWKKGVICPIYKKGDKRAAKSYRGVTLMDTAYKIYAGILDERLKAEIETKLEESQFEFRKGRGTKNFTRAIEKLKITQLGYLFDEECISGDIEDMQYNVYVAIKQGHEYDVKLLLQKGADTNIPNNDGKNN